MDQLDFSSILLKRGHEEILSGSADSTATSSVSKQQRSISPPVLQQFGLYRSHPSFSGWVIRPAHIDMMDFAFDNLPSTFDHHTVAWINLRNYSSASSSSSTEDTADTHKYCGKWMWFVAAHRVDEIFILLAGALQQGLLGDSIKVPPVSCKQVFAGSAPETATENTNQDGEGSPRVVPRVVPFIVYTKDFRDRDDVLRVGLALRKLGASRTISYKPGKSPGRNRSLSDSTEI